MWATIHGFIFFSLSSEIASFFHRETVRLVVCGLLAVEDWLVCDMVLGVNWSVVQRLKPVIMFSIGILCGAFLQNIVAQRSSSVAFRGTPHPFKLSSVRAVGVSHNPEIKKQVLAGYFDMPHITQIAKSSLKPGQIASENWYVTFCLSSP